MIRDEIHYIVRKCSKFLLGPSAPSTIHRIDECLQGLLGYKYQVIRNKVKNKIKYAGLISSPKKLNILNDSFKSLLWKYDLPIHQTLPLVSIIVPYFDYKDEVQLKKRLETIFKQTYQNVEIIILTCVTNIHEHKILTEYAGKYSGYIKTVGINKNQSHYTQWEQGIKASSGKYIWIAELDDYCDLDFLEKLIPLMDYQSVMIAFSKTVIIDDKADENHQLSKLDSNFIQWDTPFMMTGYVAVQRIFKLKNIIPSISSTIFRNNGKILLDIMPQADRIGIYYDWLFYLSIIRGGCISYTNVTSNYHNVLRQSEFMDMEDENLTSRKIIENYVKTYFNISGNSLQVLMGCCSLSLGGGETYALHLANELKRQGITVTVLDFHLSNYDEGVRQILDPSIPLVEISDIADLNYISDQLGINVIHSHHGNVDEAISQAITTYGLKCRQIITLHGMYETMPELDCRHLMNNVCKTCEAFVYIADKNLEPFKRYGYINRVKLVKLGNGLPQMDINGVNRSELGIEEEAIVLCLVSRGIPEKGWKEGIEAVKIAREKTGKLVHLVILGDGPVKEELEHIAPSYIHFLGSVSNVRDYYVMSDIGFLPSYYKGESYPLVIIEALLCGKPVIATDVGEIRNQIKDKNGELAGALIPLSEGKVNAQEVANVIISWLENKEEFKIVTSRVKSASEKFDIQTIVKEYLKLYSCERSNQ